jgi:hypothetical protein
LVVAIRKRGDNQAMWVEIRFSCRYPASELASRRMSSSRAALLP